MKFIFALLALCLLSPPALAADAPSAAADKAAPKFTLQIAPSREGMLPGQPVYKDGTSVIFIVTGTNNTDNDVPFDPGDGVFNATVLDAGGKPLPMTPAYRDFMEDHAELRQAAREGKHWLVPIPYHASKRVHLPWPHQSRKEIINIGGQYDLKRGPYTVRLDWNLPEEAGGGVVSSNAVAITIENDAPPAATNAGPKPVDAALLAKLNALIAAQGKDGILPPFLARQLYDDRTVADVDKPRKYSYHSASFRDGKILRTAGYVDASKDLILCDSEWPAEISCFRLDGNGSLASYAGFNGLLLFLKRERAPWENRQDFDAETAAWTKNIDALLKAPPAAAPGDDMPKWADDMDPPPQSPPPTTPGATPAK